NMLAAIYGIPDGDPIGFTHVFFPVDKFEEIQKKEHWIFARKEEGYLALWCSEETMEEHDDRLMGAELRVYSRNHAYAVICGSRAEDGDFREFIQKTEHMNLSYAPEDRCLFVKGKEFLRWYQSDDKTQYL
ncbi:MAG: hypothetical protein K6A92_01715, partial [Lachnospiraceae bacterium]|nr:hypothetical protein [Lachnospiraceae bacterium]